MADFKKDAVTLLKHLGSSENISSVSHCATRLRFVLVDPTKADQKAVENIPSVQGLFTQAGQFQVIIGNQVATFYHEFIQLPGVYSATKEETKLAAKQNQSVLQRIIGTFAEIFAPIIPALVVGGLILGFRNVLGEIPFAAFDDQPIVAVSQFWDGVNHFLWIIGEAIFHFLPVGITWSIARKMGGTEILGIVLGLTLVSPQLLNAYGVIHTATADIPVWDFGFTQISMIGYQAQVIPAMLAGFLLCYLELFFRKHIHHAVSMIFVPLFSLVPTVLIAHVLLGPIGWAIGNTISTVVNAGLASTLNWLFAATFGFLYAPLVITGLHHMTNAIDLQLVADFDSTNLWPMIALSNIAQGSAVLAVIFLHRGNQEEEQISIPATISCYLGVTEPAMFGINLKYLYPFVAAMIGSSIAGIFSVVTGVRAFTIGVGGLPGLLSIKIGYGFFIIAMLLAILIPFSLTIFFRQKGIFNKLDPAPSANGPIIPTETSSPEPEPNSPDPLSTESPSPIPNPSEPPTTEKISIHAPASGTLIPLEAVEDQLFSKKILGSGLGIQPTSAQLVAPVSGIVTTIFPTKHALGFLTDNGIEVLLHIGLDTVELDGLPFNLTVAIDQKVQAGDSLGSVDLEKVKKANKATDIVLVFTNLKPSHQLTLTELDTVGAGSEIGYID